MSLSGTGDELAFTGTLEPAEFQFSLTDPTTGDRLEGRLTDGSTFGDYVTSGPGGCAIR